jgi:hypothetical protein
MALKNKSKCLMLSKNVCHKTLLNFYLNNGLKIRKQNINMCGKAKYSEQEGVRNTRSMGH